VKPFNFSYKDNMTPMSQLNDALKQRRSIRHYQDRPVPVDVLKGVLEAASFAPSAHNAQPWRFVVLADVDAKETFANAMAQVWLEELERDHIPKNMRWATVNRSVERFTSAPILVLACLTMENMDSYADEERRRVERDLAVQSLSAAIQTLLLAAHGAGLGACWYCAPIFCQDAVREALQIHCSVEPQALIPKGYPAEVPNVPKRLPLEAYVHAGKWGQPF
jgi:F420 biosynthesis protein FbiB-like protein